MEPDRNIGFGTCKMEATTLVVAPLSWITEGRELQYSATVLAAVHDYNRKAAIDDFIALDFPGATYRREFAGKPGTQARLIGSHDSLAQVLNSERLTQFRRRVVNGNNANSVHKLISSFEPMSEGYCVTRSQKSARNQPGTIRRKIDRAMRRGHGPEHIAALKDKLTESEGMTAEQRRIIHKAPREAAVFLGNKPFFFTRHKVTSNGRVAKVSTYGMSSKDAPAIFGKWIEVSGARASASPTVVDTFVGLFDEEYT